MLKIEQQKAIAKLLKLDENKFLEALKSDKEADIEIPELHVFDKTELEARDKNQKKLGYDDGKEAGIEIAIKEQKTKLGLDFEGKDMDKFVTAFQTKVLADAKIEPSKQLQEKEAIIAKLQANVAEWEGKYKSEAQRNKELNLRNKLVAHVPAGLPFDPDEVLLSMQAKGYSFEEDEKGAIIPKRNGEPLRDDKTQNVLEYKAVIGSYITERGWTPKDDPGKTGRGGSSNLKTSGAITKMSEAKAAWEADGKSVNSAEFQAYVQEAAKNDKNFDWDN